MTKTIRQMSDRQLEVSSRAWDRRLETRIRKLTTIRKIRTSVHPHTKVTPDEKRKLLKQWTSSVHQADMTVTRIRAELRRRKQPLRVRALDEAGELVGIMEHGGNNRGPEVSALILEAGGVGPEPWCGDFVAVAYKRAGSQVVQRAWAAVRFLGFLTGMHVIPVRSAEPGDIVCFVWDHTGLLRYFCDVHGRPMAPATATHAACREGNTGPASAVSDSATGGDGAYDTIRPVGVIARAVHVDR